jgi:hypothetical protein
MKMECYILKFEKGLVARYKAVYKQYNFKFGDITLTDYAVEADSRESEKLYPTSLCASGPMWLEVRLRSTMSGGQARWLTLDREKLKKYCNGARYEPVLRCFVSKFTWYPPGDAAARRDRMCLDQHVLEYVGLEGEDKALADEVIRYLSHLDCDIAQMGSAVTNWLAKICEPGEVPQPEIVETNNPRRGHLRDLMSRYLIPSLVQGKAEKIFQGNLMLVKVNSDYDMEQFGWLLYPVRRTVFNHYFTTGGVIAQRDIEYLVYISEDGYVLSPGHEPMELESGLYIAEHPVPTKQRKAD